MKGMLTMVTTSSTIDEIRTTYGQIQEQCTRLVTEMENDEEKLRQTAHNLFIEGVKTVMPVIKYIEVDLKITDVFDRGIWLDDVIALTRKGVIFHKKHTGDGQHYNEWYSTSLWGDAFIDWVIKCLETMAKAFQEALTKIEERRASLTNRESRLTSAATALKQD